MWDIFLSYSHADSPFVKHLVPHLQSQGISYWLDKHEIGVGQTLIERIQYGIDNSGFLAVVISSNSVESEWVKKEVAVGIDKEVSQKQVFVLPIKIDGCRIPWLLAGKMCADFSNNYDEGLRTLIATIKPERRNIIKVNEAIVCVDLTDPTGANALVHRLWKLQALQGELSEWVDCFYVSGEIEEVKTNPIIDCYKESCGRTNLFQFRFLPPIIGKHVLNLNVHYHVTNTFLESEESWSVFTPLSSCKSCAVNRASGGCSALKIIFPSERPYRSFRGVAKSGNKIFDRSFLIKEFSIDRRKAIQWDLNNEEFVTKPEYIISWSW